jgi:hypothetical protein
MRIEDEMREWNLASTVYIRIDCFRECLKTFGDRSVSGKSSVLDPKSAKVCLVASCDHERKCKPLAASVCT